jgi:hypothetical protein
MTRKTVGKARADIAETALALPPHRGKTAAQAEPEATNQTNCETKSPHIANGVAKGTAQQLTTRLLDTLCADFAAHGADAIRSCREEQPQGYLRLIVGLLPKDIDFNDNPLKDIPDDEIITLIERFREHDAESPGAAGLDQGKGPASR